MPRGDCTGPAGMGPRTGRAMGYCSGYSTPGFMNRPGIGGGAGMGYGGSMGFGGGGGRGRRNMYYATGLPGWMRFGGMGYGRPWPVGAPAVIPENETAALRAQADYLSGMLEQIQKRLSELEKENPET